jgi:two-component system, cell cycle response regulator DivK
MIDWQDVKSWIVLLVDDEPDNLEVVAETLEYRGASVKTALNGLEALEILRDYTPNIIIADLSMPQMDGWQLRTRLKNDPKLANIPILALSAHAMAGDKERAISAGFDGYMTKPINIHSLTNDICTALQAVQPSEKTQPTEEIQK